MIRFKIISGLYRVLTWHLGEEIKLNFGEMTLTDIVLITSLEEEEDVNAKSIIQNFIKFKTTFNCTFIANSRIDNSPIFSLSKSQIRENRINEIIS